MGETSTEIVFVVEENWEIKLKHLYIQTRKQTEESQTKLGDFKS